MPIRESGLPYVDRQFMSRNLMQADIFAESPAAKASTPDHNSPQLQATAPGQLRVIKRNGTVVGYDDS